MSAVFDFIDGDTPLVVSIPHDGRELAPGMADRMTVAGRALPDTDWHVRRLYGFAEELGATVIAANYSRYVVDLNRSADDAALYPGQVSTGLCPLETFAGEPIYTGDAALSDAERQARVETYWRPYHDKVQETLVRIADRYGYALLWDAHSIRAEVPLLFDGRLPDLNIGTNGGASCRDDLSKAAGGVAAASGYSSVINGRFKGGFITRHYGDPGRGVHAIQLEIAQRTYMDEASFEYLPPAAERLRAVLAPMLDAFVSSAADAFRAQDSA